jgi:hypothetical protein
MNSDIEQLIADIERQIEVRPEEETAGHRVFIKWAKHIVKRERANAITEILKGIFAFLVFLLTNSISFYFGTLQ